MDYISTCHICLYVIIDVLSQFECHTQSDMVIAASCGYTPVIAVKCAPAPL